MVCWLGLGLGLVLGLDQRTKWWELRESSRTKTVARREKVLTTLVFNLT